MTTRRIAITGTDGTGKTTLVRRLAQAYNGRPELLMAFRAPQYHEGPDHPFGVLSAAIDALSELGDRQADPLLKATALFLSMTLYGDVERHLSSTYRPQVLVAERQCLVDSLTYARFYLPLLRAPLDAAKLEPLIESTLATVHPEAWNRVQAWLPVFQSRAEQAPCDFWHLPLYIRDLFNQAPAALLASLQLLYQTQVPDQIILLTVQPAALALRLAKKRSELGAAPQELHEQAHILGMFQDGLWQACEYLATIAPKLVIGKLDSSDRSIEETLTDVLNVIGLEA
jgi:hypothetical protein